MRTLSKFSLLLLLLLTLSLGCTAQSKYSELVEALQKKDDSFAMTLAKELEARGEKSFGLYYNLGLAYRNQGKNAFARAYFEKALWSRDQLAEVYAGHYQKIVPLLFDLAYNDPVKAQEILRDFAKAVRGVDPYKPINVELLRKAIGDFIGDGHMSRYSASSVNLTLSALFDVSHSADVFVGNKVDNLAFGLGGNDLLYGKAGNDTLFGGAGYDELYGGVGKDSLNGGMHDDILSGEAGDDFLIGAQGDDILIAGLGDDTYQYSRGDGNDIINNFDLGSERKDTLFFGDGIEPNKVRVTRDQEDLVLVLIDHNHTVRLQYFYRSPFYEINQVIFSDGTRWSLVDLLKP